MCSASCYGWDLKKRIATIMNAIRAQGLYGARQEAIGEYRHTRALRSMSLLGAFYSQGQLRLLPESGMVLGCTANQDRESTRGRERQGQKSNAVSRFVWLSILGVFAIGCHKQPLHRIPDVHYRVSYFPDTCHKQPDGSYICKARFNPQTVEAH